MVFNVEHRFNLTSFQILGVKTDFELGPFVDLGTVFANWQGVQRRTFYPVFGGSFRGVVIPSVVGSVDVGYGRDGLGTFIGINYPF